MSCSPYLLLVSLSRIGKNKFFVWLHFMKRFNYTKFFAWRFTNVLNCLYMLNWQYYTKIITLRLLHWDYYIEIITLSYNVMYLNQQIATRRTMGEKQLALSGPFVQNSWDVFIVVVVVNIHRDRRPEMADRRLKGLRRKENGMNHCEMIAISIVPWLNRACWW